MSILTLMRFHLQCPFRVVLTYGLCMLVVMISVTVVSSEKSVSPNIVLIVADDLGWDDVSFHGSDQILTPNIDLLAYSGVALGRYYSHCICTPSRSALLTGKYAHTTGMQGYPLTNSEDRGLPVTEKILPQYLKELGYATHLVGKWHVGQSRQKYLPTFRGFDTHFGHRGGYLDYYEYTLEETWTIGKVSGLGLYRNLTAAWDAEGYLTDLYNQEAKSLIINHDESMESPLFLMVAHNAPHGANAGAILQAPPEDVRSMRHVESPERRLYAAMVKNLDDSVGDIVEALLRKGILNNTIIVFISDNGGMTSGNSMNYASNWPLRGLKMSPFEGGVRVAGLVWKQGMNVSSHLWNGYMHVTDWLPTLLKAIGGERPTNIDGIDMWNNLSKNKDSQRKELLEIDDYTGFSSIILGDYKLITGSVNVNYSNYQGQDLRGIIGDGVSYSEAIHNSKMYAILNEIDKSFDMNDITLRDKIKVKCNDTTQLCFPQNSTGCLYNIKEDPCETKDLYATYPDIVEQLLARINAESNRTIPRTVPLYRDPISMPSLHNYTWDTFY